MTLVRLRGRVPGFGQLEALPAGIIAIERWNGNGPASRVSGQDYIPDSILRTAIVDGQPQEPLDILPTDGTFCIRWTIVATGADHSETPLVRFTTIPTSGEIDFGSLPDVDPSTFTPLAPLPPSAQQVLADASASATAAAAEATKAESARTSAETAKTAAEAARATATGARDAAVQAKTDAQAARDAAATSAQNAGTSATSAGTSAGDAATSASAAAGSASAAATSASDAATARTAAGDSATAAATSATNASNAATAATSARTGAESAKTAAETARGGAESAQAAAETAKTGAETAKTSSEAARTGAETAKTGADTARTGAEAAKTAAETARDVALAGQFFGSDLLTTDLNTVYSPGVYRQPNTASAQVARNYPAEGISGMLVVLSRNNLSTSSARAVQQFYPQIGANLTDARLHYERASNSGGWTPWRVFHSTRIDSPTGQPGAAAYLWNDVNNTELQLAPTMVNLGTTDINTVTYPGTYLQPSTSQTTFARNYPIESVTGVLEVSSSSSILAVVVQRFTISGGNWGAVRGVHQRRLTGGVWGAWTFIPQQRVDNTAGRAMYTWDDTTNREQLFYGDTGWRTVTTLLNGWTMSSYRIRRVGSQVSFVIGSLNGSAATSNQFETLPAGFQPYSTEGFTLFAESGSPVTVHRAYVGSAGQMTTNSPTPAVNIGGTMTWMTSQAWPTTLPGAALGSVPST